LSGYELRAFFSELEQTDTRECYGQRFMVYLADRSQNMKEMLIKFIGRKCDMADEKYYPALLTKEELSTLKLDDQEINFRWQNYNFSQLANYFKTMRIDAAKKTFRYDGRVA
jgi:hypothetical protein